MSQLDIAPNPLAGFLGRRWKGVMLALMVAIGGSLVVAELLATQTYTFVGTMFYNRSTVGAPHYQQPDVQSIVGLVKSQQVLSAAAQELKLNGPLAALAAGVQTEVVAGSNTIQFTMRGAEPRQTQASLDAIMRQVQAQAGNLRRRTIEQIVASQDAHAVKAKLSADAAAAAQAEFNARHQVIVSVDDDLERVRDDIAAVETALETQRPERDNPEEALQRRRTFLQDQQNAERERIAREAELTLKKNEYERAVRLHAKRYISDAEFRRIETEHESLVAQAGRSFEQRRQQLDQLGKELAAQWHQAEPAGSTTKPSTGAEAEVATRIRAFLEQRRAEAERLNALRAEAGELKQALATAQTEVQRTSVLRAGYDELRNADFHDLDIVQPAAPALEPVTSNKKKLWAGVGVGIFLALLAPLLFWDLTMRRPPSVAARNQGLNLPHINRSLPRDSTDLNDVVRTLALRIQQTARENGSVALFTDTAADNSSPALAVAVANCLAQRGESVLVIETSADLTQRKVLTAELSAPRPVRLETAVVADWIGGERTSPAAGAAREPSTVIAGSPAPGGGLAELLSDRHYAADDAIRRGKLFDVLLAGDKPLPPEAFAGRRLTELLEELKRRYSTILVLGPDVAHSIDLEMLAARVTSLVFVASNNGDISPQTQHTVESLNTLSAPILGLVTV